MGQKVLFPQFCPQVLKNLLLDMGYESVDGTGISEEDIISDIQRTGCEAIVARTAESTPRSMEAAKGQVKIIARYGVGLDAIDLKAAEKAGIWVSFTPLANASTVAEHTVGLMIASAHNMSYCMSETRKGNFGCRNEFTGQDVMGKTVGIAGFGKIGSIVGKICHLGLGMKVLAYDPYLPDEKIPEWVEKVSWEKLFQESDFVCCHMPLVESTRGIVGKKEFEMMKPSGIFLNAARGGVVDESALIEALRKKEIAAAGLDVTASEPIEPDNPLLTMPNVNITPHMASFTKECYDRMARHTAQCIQDVLTGHEPSWPANKVKKGM